MPSNFLTEYRERLRAYHTALHRETYLFASGQKERLEAKFLAADFTDLFSATARHELQQEYEATPLYRETERASLPLLIAQATHETLTARVRDLTEEIHAYDAHATVMWEGERIGFQPATQLLKQESHASRRHDLAARCAEVSKGAQDLQAERLAKLHDMSQTLGAENYLALYQKLRGLEYEKLAAQAQKFLAQTESKYVAALAPLLMREANVTLDEATRDDLGYFQQLKRFDPFFPAWQLQRVYRETFAGLGILTYQQANLFVDERLSKAARAQHFPVRVPDEIKVVCAPADGVNQFVSFLHETGAAQRYAWMSRHLFPEFQVCGDAALQQGFALLFSQLPHDTRWLAELLHVYEGQELRHILAVQKLLRIRRAAAQLVYEVELHAGQLHSSAGARYSELLTDAVRVRYDETEHLRAVEDGLAVADTLRAWAFVAQLREYLKTKFGSQWWTSRKAGDFLIDLWNTGGRYTAEEMAKMADLGELSFDWLAEECLANLHP